MNSSIFRSTFPPPIYPGGISLPAFLRSNLTEKLYDDVSQICSDSGVEYSFRQIIDMELRFASALQDGKFGLEHGCQVALILPSIPEYFAIALGVLDAGMTAALFNPNYSETVVCTRTFYERMKALFAQFKIEVVITVGANENGIPNFFDLVHSHEPMTLFRPTDENKNAIIFLTSGTTGNPKGAGLSHKNIISYIIGCRVFTNGHDHGGETQFLPVNSFHIGGFCLGLWAFDQKWKNVTMQERISKVKLEAVIKNYRPSIIWAVATLLSLICTLDNLTAVDFSQLKTILFAGGNVDEGLLKRLRSKVGMRVGFMSGYGATELGCITCFAPVDETQLGGKFPCGKMLPGLELKVIDLETGKMMGENEDGELCFRGPMVFKGYVNNDEANKRSLRDGWFHTGDVGHIDEDGLIYIAARVKEIIRVHGYQVAPEEIENVIKKHELVELAVVFGVSDPRTQEAPRALIVPRSDTLTEDDIHGFLKDKLVYYKQLRGGIRFVKSLPTTPGVNKLSRKAAKELDAAMSKIGS